MTRKLGEIVSRTRPVRYLSKKEIAEYIGVKQNTIGRYRLPVPDVQVGNVFGWSEERIARWNECRPGQGNWHKQWWKETWKEK